MSGFGFVVILIAFCLFWWSGGEMSPELRTLLAQPVASMKVADVVVFGAIYLVLTFRA
jgi:hypothetical protein